MHDKETVDDGTRRRERFVVYAMDHTDGADLMKLSALQQALVRVSKD